jgi:hypothetical protein
LTVPIVSNFAYDNALMNIGGDGGTTYGANHILVTNSEFVNAPDGMFVGTSLYSNDIQFINNKLHDGVPFSKNNKGGTFYGQSICWGYPFYWGASGRADRGNKSIISVVRHPYIQLSGCDGVSIICRAATSCAAASSMISAWLLATPPPAFGAGDRRVRVS